MTEMKEGGSASAVEAVGWVLAQCVQPIETLRSKWSGEALAVRLKRSRETRDRIDELTLASKNMVALVARTGYTSPREAGLGSRDCTLEGEFGEQGITAPWRRR